MMALNSVSEVTQLYLAILAVILGAMVIGIGPSSRKPRSRGVPSVASSPSFQTGRPLPTTNDVLERLEKALAELRLETPIDETQLESLALFKETNGQNEAAEIQEFVNRLFDITRRLACLRYLIEHTTGSDRIALGNMKIRAMKQTQALERELDQLRRKVLAPSIQAEIRPTTVDKSGD